MMASASRSVVIAWPSLGVMSGVTSAVETSLASSRSSITDAVAVFPCLAASAATRSAVRSASILVDDGSLVPALITAMLNCWDRSGVVILLMSLVVSLGSCGGGG